MRVESGVTSREKATRSKQSQTKLAPTRSRHSKPGQPNPSHTKPAPGKAAPKGGTVAKPAEWLWHPFPAGTLIALREAGFVVAERDDGYWIQPAQVAGHNLVHIHRTPESNLLAQAATNAHVTRPEGFWTMARQARVGTDRALVRLSQSGSIDIFVATMKGIRGQLAKACVIKVKPRTTPLPKLKPKPKKKAVRIPSGYFLNPEERSTSVRAASAGLPGQGKRR